MVAPTGNPVDCSKRATMLGPRLNGVFRQDMKKLLNEMVGVAKWLPFSLPYRLSALLSLPARVQVQLMPPTLRPFVVWVPLEDVVLETRQKHRFPHLRFCWPGNWDQDFTRPLCTLDGPNDPESPFLSDFDTIRQVCRDAAPLSEVIEYRAMLDAVRGGGSPRGCRTEADVGQYFRSLIKVSESIGRDGYKCSIELGGLARDEVSVWITRDGKLVYGGWANHRLALAKLHRVSILPVSILGCHPDWLVQLCSLYRLPPHLALREWASQFSR